MPSYDYKCSQCRMTATEQRSIDNVDTLPACPICLLPMNRSYEFGSVVFKGHGFYSTDK
jgi:putative FmdB family regulatory protein